MSVLALIAGAPIHPTIRLEPHGLLFLFFFFSSILDRHTEKLSNFRSSTQEARVWSRAIPIYFALGTKWRVSAVSPTIPWPSTGHATYIYIYIHYRPIRSSSVVQGIYNNLPVMLSQSIRDVMILPYGLNRFSRSCCVMFFGKPLTYKFAPLIASLLGLAYDTCIIIN